jgi:hypothetical protein
MSIEETVCIFEDEHRIADRWVIRSEQFTEGQRNISTKNYREALNKLEHLVVQRLLELTKLNTSGLGKNDCISATAI